MATYQVKLVGRSHEVIGLSPECFPEYSSTVLIHHYDGGDCDTHMRNAEMMLGALYGLYQCHDAIKEGDRFETEFGNFVCVSFHVVPETQETAQALVAADHEGSTQNHRYGDD